MFLVFIIAIYFDILFTKRGCYILDTYKMNKVQVSIIVPIYNVENYLRRCLDSILAQTFKDWECILIDDGSKDESGKICDEYACNYDRFLVVHQTNKGASVARNRGIAEAKGQYVAFVDADDFLMPHYLEGMLETVSEKNFLIIQKYGREGQAIIPFKEKKIYEGQAGIKQFVEDGYLSYSAPHSKLFSLITIKDNQVLFPEGVKIGEDLIFIIRYLQYTDNIIVSDKTGYVYINNQDSIQHRWHHIDSERNDYQQMRGELMKFCDNLSISTSHVAIWRILGPRMRKYVKTACSLDFKDALREMQSIDKRDYLNYGEGISGSLQSRLFKYYMNHRMFFFIICMIRLERIKYPKL